MSDYLSNLAARSLEQTEVVQPRPVSLFAPSPRLTGWPSPDPATGFEIEEREQIVEAAPVASQPQSFDPGVERSLTTIPTTKVLPLLPTARPQSQPAPLPPVVRTEIQHQVSAAPAPPLLIPAQPPLQAQPTRVATTERVVVERAIVPPAPAERVVIERINTPAPPPLPEPHTTPPAQRQPMLAPLTERVEIERIIMPTPAPPSDEQRQSVPVQPTARPAPPTVIVAQPKVAPAQPNEPIQPDLPRPEPVPTIQVTIGRIEVRATPPPAQPTRSTRSTPPVMGLDEYLRSRNGGGR